MDVPLEELLAEKRNRGKRIVLTPEIPDGDIERIHNYLGRGRPSEVAYRHIPSGITVGRVRPPDAIAHEIDSQLFGELIDKLKAAGILPRDP